MPAPNLPNILLKLGLALAKHHIKNVIGDEALEIAATTLTDVGGEKVQAKVDSIFASKEGQKELLKAAKAADERFKEKCKDNDLRQLFTMDYGDLPSVQDAIASLPKALDDDTLRETLFTAFRNDSPKSISNEQINEGVNLYVECLQSALIPVKDFGLRIIHNALKEIGKDVKDIKADVKLVLEKIQTGSQGAAGTKNVGARFLVPFPHNPDFVGRETELSSLHEMLQQGQSIVGIRPTVLVGLGGIGKTQLAVEYAHAYRADYPNGVFWLNAINPLLFEFSDLAEKLEISDRDTPRDKAARKVWDYLDSHPDSLVIFDNVLEPSELNLPFSPDLVPANLRCRTLFTTRQRDFPRTFQPFEVKVLPEMAAMKLLLRSRPEVLEEHHPEWGWARIVCAYLGWLPLALELAAAYLGAYPEVSITGYLERLRTEGSLETVDESEVRAIDLPTRVEEILKAAAAGNLELKHQVAVSATLQTQWNRLSDEDAKLLFRAAGQFPEASWIPIPRLGLLAGIESEAKAGRPSPLNVVLKKLHAVSLIEELSDDRLRLHPLVQEFAARLLPAPVSFRMEMAERVAAEFDDLLYLKARVIRYGVDMALEDIRTALGFCMDKPETETYSRISNMERVLDRQAHVLRNWRVRKKPINFLQQIRQIRNEAFAQGLEKWQAQAEAELARLGKPYLLERFPIRSDSAELRTLTGHSDTVNSVALSADGRLAVSASNDKTLKVWDVLTGRELHTLTGHDDKVKSVTLNADGRLAVSVSEDKTLKVWDVPTGRELRTLAGHSGDLRDVALSADGRLVISASNDKTLKVWDVPTGRELRTLIGHNSWVTCVTLSADGQLAISASKDMTLKVWNVTTGRELRTLIGHVREVNDVALSADGQLAVSASDDKTLKVWDVKTGRELRTLKGHSDWVNRVALSANGQLAISASKDNTLKIWDVEAGKELGMLTRYSYLATDIALNTNGQLAISASDGSALKVWDISKALALDTVEETKHNPIMSKWHDKSVSGVSISADGCLAISASDDKTLKIWDVETGHELHTLTGHNGVISELELSPTGQLAISGSKDRTLVWDIKTGRELSTLSRYVKTNYGQITVSALDKNIIKARASYERLWSLIHNGHNGNVVRIALSTDGQLSVSVSDDQTIKVWNIPSRRCIATLLVGVSLTCCAMSTNGKIIVAGDSHGRMHFIELVGEIERIETPQDLDHFAKPFFDWNKIEEIIKMEK